MVRGKSETIVILAAISLAITLTTVALRCFVRFYLVKAFGWDDSTMIVAAAMFLGMTLCGIIGAIYGLGQRSYYFATGLGNHRNALLCSWLGEFFYALTCMAAKISILISLHRIAIERLHRWFIYAASILTVIMGCLFTFFVILQCRPVSNYWNRTPTGSCASSLIISRAAYAYSVGEFLTDLTIGILPWFLIQHLRVNRKQKICLAVVLGIGCSASIVVIVRIPYFALWSGEDILYSTAEIALWSQTEAALGIVAGSVVTLRPLLRIIWGQSSMSRYSEEPYRAHIHPTNSRPVKNEDYHSFLKQQTRHHDDDSQTERQMVSLPPNLGS